MKGKIARTGVLFCVTFMLIFTATSIKSAPADHVIVYYFHGNARCPSCIKIENYTNNALNEYFAKELDSDRLIFRPVNVDEKQNRHFVKDYGIYTRSVVISLVKGGKEVKHQNLTKVWDYLWNSQKFYEYIRSEVGKYLGEAT